MREGRGGRGRATENGERRGEEAERGRMGRKCGRGREKEGVEREVTYGERGEETTRVRRESKRKGGREKEERRCSTREERWEEKVRGGEAKPVATNDFIQLS